MASMEMIAVDLGASSGKVVCGSYDGHTLSTRLLRRFENIPVFVRGTLHWNVLSLYGEILASLREAGAQPVASLGIDSWGNDFGLLDEKGDLIANPVHYRDARTLGAMEKVFARVPAREVFSQTGVQLMRLNALYQLFSLYERRMPQAEFARTFLLIPDLLIYFLTGIRCSEFTNATTTQMFDPIRRDWAREMLKKLSIPDHLFTQAVYPGTVLGALDAECQFKPGLKATRVVAVAQHDTASAVMGVPAKDEDFAYISSGTWSLLGTELKSPVINDKAFSFNFTNEGGAFGTWRLLKNVMGLWILQECQRHWAAAGREYDFGQLEQAAESAAPFQCLIDPDDERFVPPSDMPGRIRAYCRETGQPQPETVGEIVRCVLESLALKYMIVFEQLEEITEKSYSAIYIVGGGVRNRLLCFFTAQATGKTVLTGSAEATAVGNLMVQAASLGEVKGIGEIREVIRRSFAVTEFPADARSDWSEARGRFRALLQHVRE